jgi:hypothetical protein
MGKSARNRQTLAILNEGNQETIVNYMKENKLLNTEVSPVCQNEKCEGFQTRKMQWTVRKSVKECFSWRCTKCGTHKSIKDGSFFQGTRLLFSQTLLLIFYWCMQTISQEEVAKLVDCSRSTVGTVYQRLRFICSSVNKMTKITLGGYGRTVEIDESLFIRVKHHKGIYRNLTKNILYQ